MKMQSRFFSGLALSSLLLLSAARPAFAQVYTSSRSFTVIGLDSANTNTADNSGVAVKALFEFDQTLGYLRITIDNLSGTGSYTDGVLQGFGFDGTAGLTYVANSFAVESVTAGEPGGVNYTIGLGYSFSGLGTDGNFDFGAGTAGANGNGGGSPDDGLAGGYSAAFRFQFSGDLSNFNAGSFFGANGDDADFGFRFQGVTRVNSEKIVYFATDEAPPVPEPSTYGMIGALALLAIVGWRKLRVHQAALA
jgi:hypothetical protein